MEVFPGVSADAAVRFGKPCIAGTRMDIATVVAALGAGESYADVERDFEVAYEHDTATASLVEGLAVDGKNFWFCIDNNGRGRRKSPQDTRPTLFKCRRPDLGN